MTKHTIGTKAHCEAVQAVADKIMGYPKTVTKGLAQPKDEKQLAADALMLTKQANFVERFVGKVDMPHYANVRRHPTYSTFAFPITKELEDEYLNSMGEGLTVAEDELLFDAIDGAKELPPSWEPEDITGWEP